MLNKEKWLDIRTLFVQNMNIKDIAEKVGCDRKTVRKYCKYFYFPKYKTKQDKKTDLEPYKNYIKEKIRKTKTNAKKIHQELQMLGFQGSYWSVCRYVKKYKKNTRDLPYVRYETLPGVQAQADWAYCGTIKEKRKIKRLYCFVMVLGYSRMCYIEFITSKNTASFIQCHLNAFLYFGGHTKEILYDNSKNVIIKRKNPFARSQMNLEFEDFAAFYGFSTKLCLPGRPQTKGKVENIIKYMRNNFFRKTDFCNLEELNNKAKIWLKKANLRIHKTTQQRPLERLKKEGLIPLNKTFVFKKHRIFKRKVSLDCHINFQGNRYSLPYRFAGETVDIEQKDNNKIIIYKENEKIYTHNLIDGTGKTVMKHSHTCGLYREVKRKKHLRRVRKLNKFLPKKKRETISKKRR